MELPYSLPPRPRVRMRVTQAREALAFVVVVVLLAGCAGTTVDSPVPVSPDVPIATPSPTPGPSPTPPPPPPTPEPTPTPVPLDISFSSTVYPYSIVLPGEAFQPGPIAVVPPPGTWKSAREVWDGTSVVSPSEPKPNDSTFDGDGDTLFIVGHPTGDDVEAFAARMVDRFALWHGCSRTPSTRATQVDGAPAILIASPCARGAASAFAARLFVVHESFGLVFILLAYRPVEAEDQMDRLARYVAEVDLLP